MITAVYQLVDRNGMSVTTSSSDEDATGAAYDNCSSEEVQRSVGQTPASFCPSLFRPSRCRYGHWNRLHRLRLPGCFAQLLSVTFSPFELCQNLFRSFDHCRRQAGKPRHVNPITVTRRALDQIAQENNFPAPFFDCKIVILDAFLGLR